VDDVTDPLGHILKMKGNGVGNTVSLKLVAQNLVSPLGLTEAPDGSKRLFIFDQAGKVYIVDSSGTQLSTPFLDLTSRLVSLSPFYDERGLIGFTFHPQFSTNGKFYVHYQSPPELSGYNNLTVISEFTAARGSNTADLATERRILEINDPQMNHNGGTLAFGRDGYMYIAIGDGGDANDTAFGHVQDWYAFNKGGNGQDIDSNLFGGILRIDVNAVPYAIPGDNPFVGTTHKQETWAYGMRNPYRMSFDMATGELYSMDAGQSRYEEINRVVKGGNYGWNVKEGRECFNAANAFAEVEDCPSVDNLGHPLIDPVIQLNNWLNPEGGIATTIIGGNVYRGTELKSFQGKYIFGIFSHTPTTADGQLFWADPSTGNTWDYHELNLYQHPGDIGYYLKGFGQDLSGEMYVTVSSLLGPTGNTGKVYMLTSPK
jgi:glucose/arabinose dehydrogenase